MNREHEIPAHQRDISDLQRRIDELSKLEKLEGDGVRTHTITELLDPTSNHLIINEVHRFRVHGKSETKPL